MYVVFLASKLLNQTTEFNFVDNIFWTSWKWMKVSRIYGSFCLMCISLNWRQSMSMCLTVMSVPLVSHEGESSLATRKPCVMRLWPIRRRPKITSSLLDITYGSGHVNIICLIYLNYSRYWHLSRGFAIHPYNWI